MAVDRSYLKMMRAVRRYIEQTPGWRLRKVRHGTIIYPPTGDTICCAGSPGDRRSKLNAKSQLKRAGIPPEVLR